MIVMQMVMKVTTVPMHMYLVPTSTVLLSMFLSQDNKCNNALGS